MRNIIAIAALAALFAGCGDKTPPVEEGERALANGDFKAAAKIFKAAVKAHPSSVPLHYNLGTAQSLAGDTAGAIASFREVLRFTPGDLDASEALAAELRKTGTSDALFESHELLEFVLPYREEPAARARLLNSLALTESALHRNDLALARFLAARDAAPGYAPTFYNLGHLCAHDLKIPAMAITWFDAFIAAAPDRPDLVDAARAQRKDLAAKAASGSQAEDDLKRGADAYTAGDYAQAVAIFTGSVIPRQPDDPLGLRFATFAYSQQGRYYEARLYGALHLAATKRANPKEKTADFEGWLAKLPDVKFKP